MGFDVSGELAGNSRSGYRAVGALLLIGSAAIGFTRFEDRAIIGTPGSPANAMAAFAAAPAESGETTEDYSGAPEEFTTLSGTSRAPRNRIRQALSERSIPRAAARQIVGPPPSGTTLGDGIVPDSQPPAALIPALASDSAGPPTFASLAPPPPGTGTPVFAANVPPSGGGGGGGGGTGGGTGGGGDGGTGGTPTDPVSAVPEPSTWLLLIMGVFGIGAAMRRRTGSRSSPAALVR